MSTPVVTVLVTTYNRQQQLQETLLSIVQQTFTDFEIVLVDNFSNYDIAALVQDIGDSRIHLYQNQNNGIIAVNRNFGLARARGQYIAFCDDDDVWHAEKLEEQMRQISDEQCGLCFTKIEFIDEQSKPIDREYTFRSLYKRLRFNDFILSLGFICNSSVLITREAVEQVGVLNTEPALRTVEDYHYWARIIKRFKACYVDKPLVRYRIQQQSGTNSVNARQWYAKQRHLLATLSRDVGIPPFVFLAKFLKISVYYLKLQWSAIVRRSV